MGNSLLLAAAIVLLLVAAWALTRHKPPSRRPWASVISGVTGPTFPIISATYRQAHPGDMSAALRLEVQGDVAGAYGACNLGGCYIRFAPGLNAAGLNSYDYTTWSLQRARPIPSGVAGVTQEVILLPTHEAPKLDRVNLQGTLAKPIGTLQLAC